MVIYATWESSTDRLWSPSKYSRVCSEHFVDEDATDENPNLTQKLGYDAGRKVEKPHCEKHRKTTPRRRKLSLTKNSETDQNVRSP